MTKFDSAIPLKDFINSKRSFEILYNTRHILNLTSVDRLCVLDSSFNPPHNAHKSLIYKSFHYDYIKRSAITQNLDGNVGLLLLLSVKNADKIVPKPASFEHRINMMCLMADRISTDLNVNVSVGLTEHAKFVDKSVSIVDYLKAENQYRSQLKLTFLLGFDTLIRIFDPKYYQPVGVEESLQQFMEISDLFVLTRADSADSPTSAQFNYLKAIKEGCNSDVPRSWGDKIFLENGDDQHLNVSSSAVRASVSNGAADWKQDVYEEVAEYIEKHKLY